MLTQGLTRLAAEAEEAALILLELLDLILGAESVFELRVF